MTWSHRKNNPQCVHFFANNTQLNLGGGGEILKGSHNIIVLEKEGGILGGRGRFWEGGVDFGSEG